MEVEERPFRGERESRSRVMHSVGSRTTSCEALIEFRFWLRSKLGRGVKLSFGGFTSPHFIALCASFGILPRGDRTIQAYLRKI